MLGNECGANCRRRQGRPGKRTDGRLETDDALGRALCRREVVDVVAVGEIAELQRAVHRPADGGAIAPALPWRQLEVDGVLAETFVAGGTGVVPDQVFGEPCGADRQPAVGIAKCAGAFVLPCGDVVPLELVRRDSREREGARVGAQFTGARLRIGGAVGSEQHRTRHAALGGCGFRGYAMQ